MALLAMLSDRSALNEMLSVMAVPNLTIFLFKCTLVRGIGHSSVCTSRSFLLSSKIFAVCSVKGLMVILMAYEMYVACLCRLECKQRVIEEQGVILKKEAASRGS